MGKDIMKKISDIRTYLMGVAILAVMVFHTSKIFVVPWFIEPIQRTGYLGVDIFFFVSAYGLFYSMKKPVLLRQWYLRRLKRILPAFWVVSIFMGVMVHWGIYEHLREEIFFGFLCPWANQDEYYNVIFWYIPAALLFYFLFPLFYKYRKEVMLWYIPIVMVSFALSHVVSQIFNSRGWAPYIPGFIGRIPVFLLGMIVAEHEDNIKKILKWPIATAVVMISLFTFILLESHAMKITSILSFPCDDFFFMLCSLPFICCLCSLLQKFVKILNPFILYCGRYSLELYLLHVAFTRIVPRSELFEGINTNYTFGGAFLLSFPCAWLLHKGLSRVIR